MYLNIILTLLVLVLIIITVLVIVWWNKFGKQLFKTMTTMNKIIPTNPSQKIKSNEITSMFKDVFDIMDKLKK